MTKFNISLLLIILMISVTGCGQATFESGVDEPQQTTNEPQHTDVESIDGTEQKPDESVDGPTGSGVKEDILQYEYTAKERALLSINLEKLKVFNIGWQDESAPNFLEALQDKYADLALIDSKDNQYIVPHWPKEGQKTETWYSESTKLSYLIQHSYTGDDLPGTWLYAIYGQAEALITGLIAPIKISELMNAIGIPDDNWAIGEAPNTTKYNHEDINLYYDKSFFNLFDSYDKNSLYLILPEPDNENITLGIIINLAEPGFISPNDELEIRSVTFFAD